MKIFFAGAHDGSNTDALLKHCGHHRLGDECYTFGYESFDVVFTNNGRLVESVPGRLKVNTQHGNLFLGDTKPEPQYGIDLALAASESEKSMMVHNGYRSEDVLVTGQPRMDLLYDAVHNTNVRNPYLESVGLDISKPTVLYAPTYSRKAFGGGTKFFFASSTNNSCDVNMMRELLETCDEYGCNLIIRLHKYMKRDYHTTYQGQLLPDHLHQMLMYRDRIVVQDNEAFPDSIPVLVASDILITDFSSITADFLALDREIIFIEPHDGWKYTNQWHAQKADRYGMGSVCSNHLDVPLRLSINAGSGRIRRRAMRDKYQPLFDGNCCGRVYDAVMERVNG